MIIYLVNLCFLDLNTNRLKIEKDFLNKSIDWRFQVIYAFDVKMNKAPENGNCTINPMNSTIDTLFTINCSNWKDSDGIKDNNR